MPRSADIQLLGGVPSTKVVGNKSFVDLVQVREPRLMVPRQLPVGRVTTDKSKAGTLVAAYVMSITNTKTGGNVGGYGTRDIHNNALDLLGYSTSPALPNQLVDGIYFPAPGGTTYCRINHPNENAIQFNLSYLSIQTRIRRDDLGNYRRIFSRGSDGTTKSRYDAYLDAASNTLFFDFYDSGGTLRAIDSSLTVPQGWSDIGISYDGGSVTFVVNGSVSVVSAAHGAIKSTAGNYFVIGAYNDRNTHQFLGMMSHFYLWGSAIPTAKLLDYGRDPYQFLVPA